MFLREAPKMTLKDVKDQLNVKTETLSALSSEIELNLTADEPTIRIKNIEVPATPTGIQALGARYEVPTKYIQRIDRELQQHTLTHLLSRTPQENLVIIDDSGIREVLPQTIQRIDHRRIADIAGKVLGDEAPVLNFWKESGREFRLDAIVPQDNEQAWGGDKKVGDLTGAGLRFGHNIKQAEQAHAPTVSLMLYRLACTNGYEDVDEFARVDARGSSVDEVLAEYEALADRLFKRAEDKISAFYEMRSTRVENPEQRILRHATEHGIPDRITTAMIARVPEYVADSEESYFSEFDLVNLVTNQANDPSITRDGTRRNLQALGGNLIGEHSARCTHCQSKLTSH